MDLQRKLLDELMGQDRNRAKTDRPSARMHWSDEQVCKHYLVKFCPHELFTNTKADLGHCDKIHDEALKHEYQKSDRKGTYGYEQDFASFMTKILADLDRKIRGARERLSKSNAKEASPVQTEETDTKMLQLDQKIQDLVQKMETCGEEGKVDEAQTLMRQVDIMRAEKEALKNSANLSGPEKRMEVCDTCGAFLVVGDTQKRTDSHLEGKQHTGYDMIRKALDEFKNFSSRPQRRDSRGGEYRDRDRDREPDRDRDRDRDRDYDRDRRDYRHSRGRDYDRDRDRDRDRYRYDRDRDSDRRPRSRSRSRSPGSKRY